MSADGIPLSSVGGPWIKYNWQISQGWPELEVAYRSPNQIPVISISFASSLGSTHWLRLSQRCRAAPDCSVAAHVPPDIKKGILRAWTRVALEEI